MFWCIFDKFWSNFESSDMWLEFKAITNVYNDFFYFIRPITLSYPIWFTNAINKFIAYAFTLLFGSCKNSIAHWMIYLWLFEAVSWYFSMISFIKTIFWIRYFGSSLIFCFGLIGLVAFYCLLLISLLIITCNGKKSINPKCKYK